MTTEYNNYKYCDSEDENYNEYDAELTIERFKRENPNWTEKETLDYFEP